MWDTIIHRIEEKIKYLERMGKQKSEVYLGVSILNDDANARLKELGWRTIYIEQGIFQLSKL